MLPRFWPAVLTLGWMLLAIAAGELAMALFSLAMRDGLASAFGANAVITAGFAGACILTTKGHHFHLRFRDAVILVVLCWLVVPAFVALPFMAKSVGLSVVDAYFEAVSGLTTTGATVLTGLDRLPPSILMWRSTSQWIGGIGIIGIAITILPYLRIGGMQLFRLEFSDRSDKAMPRARAIASAVGQIYLALTLVCFLVYWLLGMTPFDALNHAFTTLSTGGYSTHDKSFAYFRSPSIEWAAVIFMLAGAVPFLSYLRLMRRGSWRDRVEPQVIVFLAIVVALSISFAAWIEVHQGFDAFRAMTLSAFSVVSIITTTGYASIDYLSWGTFAASFVLMVSFIGGCTGSTAGGVKVLRYEILFGVVRHHLRQAVFPHSVGSLRYDARVVTDEQIASIGTFVFSYFACVAFFACLLSIAGLDAATSLSAAAASIGNIGPGVATDIGPVGSYAGLPEAAKVVLSFAMLIGRLEVLAVLLLFMPSFYR